MNNFMHEPYVTRHSEGPKGLEEGWESPPLLRNEGLHQLCALLCNVGLHMALKKTFYLYLGGGGEIKGGIFT
jgi:hypothetical protein